MEAIDLINLIQPEHSRTSCSDENIFNGFYVEDNGVINPKYPYRCKRCALLEIIDSEFVELTEENKAHILTQFIL
jgi:hypothetical protein